MLVEIQTLAERAAFEAVLSNATGYRPISTMDIRQLVCINTKEADEAFSKKIREKRVLLFIHRLFAPFENIPTEVPACEQYRRKIRNEYIKEGFLVLTWILKNDVPFFLAKSDEMKTDLENLRRLWPETHKAAVAADLEFDGEGGWLDTEPLALMGTYNPDKDRDGEQFVYGDLLDRIRDCIGWKDHELAVRLIGEYAIRHFWNGSGVERKTAP